MSKAKKLLMLRTTKVNASSSVLSRKIKVSGRQTKNYKSGASSVLSTKIR